MPLKFLFRYLANSEYIVQKLAESAPVRRLAQLTVYMINKAPEILQMLKHAQRNTPIPRAQQSIKDFSDRFKENLKDGFQKMNEELKKKQDR